MSRPSLTFVSLVLVLAVAASALALPGSDASGAAIDDAVASPGDVPSPDLQLSNLIDLGDVVDSLDLCPGSLTTLLPLSGLCTHGPDPAPPGFDVARSVAPLRDAVTREAANAASCEGDGRSGFRIQVLYVHGADVASRYDRYQTSIRTWVAEMDQIFQASAAETGGARGLRLVHDADCLPVIEAVRVSPTGDEGFDRTIVELKDRGHGRRDRMYLAFVDTTAAGLCGIGTVWSDDRADGRVNRNNIGPAYSRIDAGCWDGDTAAHEVMHNLGGVQHSAPNSSGGFHCIDEWDLMCYRDSAQATTRTDCANRDRDVSRFDCNHDDYFHTAPPAGSYLANHWNAANNRFLAGAPSPAVKQTSGPKKAKDKKKKGKHDKKRGGKKSKGGKGKRR